MVGTLKYPEEFFGHGREGLTELMGVSSIRGGT